MIDAAFLELTPKITAIGPGKADWLRVAAAKLAPVFGDCGLEFPKSFQFRAHPRGNAHAGYLGLCDQHRREIWLSERCADTAQALTVLTHELLHLVAVNDAGHGREFARVAACLDLHRAPHGVYIAPGPKLADALRRIEAEMPPMPERWAAQGYAIARHVISTQAPWHL